MSLNGTTWTPIGPSPIDQGGITANGQVTAIAVNPNNPNIMYIGTAWGGIWHTRNAGSNWTPITDPNDEHLPHDVRAGEQFLFDIWQAVSQSPAWEKILLIITYDEHGGTYDHVTPPWNATCPDAKSNPGQQGFTFDRFGVRVPAILVSLDSSGNCFPFRLGGRCSIRSHIHPGNAARLAADSTGKDAAECPHCRGPQSGARVELAICKGRSPEHSRSFRRNKCHGDHAAAQRPAKEPGDRFCGAAWRRSRPGAEPNANAKGRNRLLHFFTFQVVKIAHLVRVDQVLEGEIDKPVDQTSLKGSPFGVDCSAPNTTNVEVYIPEPQLFAWMAISLIYRASFYGISFASLFGIPHLNVHG